MNAYTCVIQSNSDGYSDVMAFIDDAVSRIYQANGNLSQRFSSTNIKECTVSYIEPIVHKLDNFYTLLVILEIVDKNERYMRGVDRMKAYCLFWRQVVNSAECILIVDII